MKKITIFLLLTTNLFSHFDHLDLEKFEKKCMICHDTYVKNDLAPPIVAINKRYKDYYGKNIELSISKIRDFLLKPEHNKAIMKPAVKLFGLMPKQELNSKELESFPEIIMLLDYEEPKWLNEHYKSHNFEEEKKNQLP